VNATTIAGIDGADAVYTSTAGPNTAATVSPFGIGSDIEGGISYYPLTGYLHELIVFNQTLTLGQLNSIETYLSKKWGGIPLSYSVPTTPLFFSPTISPVPIISNTLTNQPSIFFPPGGQMGSILNSGLGAPTIPGCTLWLDASDPNATGVPADNGTAITIWKDKSGLGSNATGSGTDFAWKSTSSNKEWYGVAMSKDGKNLAACGSGDAGIQISTNYGDSWTSTGAGGNTFWKCVAISSD
jgi:hypothetical protein